MKHVLISLLFIFLTACNETPKQKEVLADFTTSKIDTITVKTVEEKPDSISDSIDFDILKFKSQSDSLISNIFNKSFNYDMEVDTLRVFNPGYTDKIESPYYHLIKYGDVCISYNFGHASPNKAYRFHVTETKFSSESSTDSAFAKVLHIANHDRRPGITYGNDYVIKQPLKIYWLSIGCVYSYQNYMKEVSFLKHAISKNSQTDSIVCLCGDAVCDDR